jgi:hypothetical protein
MRPIVASRLGAGCREGVAEIPWRRSDDKASGMNPDPGRSDPRRHPRIGALAARSPSSMPTGTTGRLARRHRAPVFPRSAVKVLQALPLVASGAAEQLGLGDAELAVACASHNGEPEHTAVVARMLAPRRARRRRPRVRRALAVSRADPAADGRGRRRAERAAQQLLGQARRLPLRRLPHGGRRRPAPLRPRLRRRRSIR